MLKNIIKRIIKMTREKKLLPIVQLKREGLLDRRTALITGGSGGIGFAIAKKYVDSGCKVIIAGTNELKLKKKTEELGDRGSYILLDLCDVSSFSDRLSEAERKAGGKLDILVNCAGIHFIRDNFTFLSFTENEYDSIMNVNLKGTYFLSQCFAKYLIENKLEGHILMISSQSALEPAWTPYRLSKWGINALTKGLASSLLPYNIIVNGIGPGPTATSMQSAYKEGGFINTDDTPNGRFTMPEEIAEYAVLLASELGDAIVGDTLYMTGGRGVVDVHR